MMIFVMIIVVSIVIVIKNDENVENTGIAPFECIHISILYIPLKKKQYQKKIADQK